MRSCQAPPFWKSWLKAQPPAERGGCPLWTSEAPDAYHQTVEKDNRKRPTNISKAGQNKRKKPTDKYEGIQWQKEPRTGEMQRRLFTGVAGIYATVATESPTDIFELMNWWTCRDYC